MGKGAGTPKANSRDGADVVSIKEKRSLIIVGDGPFNDPGETSPSSKDGYARIFRRGAGIRYVSEVIISDV